MSAKPSAEQTSLRNKTLRLSPEQESALLLDCARIDATLSASDLGPGGPLDNRVIHQDLFEVLPLLPSDSVDLVIADPPYNIRKSFHGRTFGARSHEAYVAFVSSWMSDLARILKPGGSLYVCSEWNSGRAVQEAADGILKIRNRITWEREKGRGSRTNWKNASEDIWFFSKGEPSFFDSATVKVRKRVVAPYRNSEGNPKDWVENHARFEDPGPDGKAEGGAGRRPAYRDTFASNLWTDLTVPFWSMGENTEHPTQKPEKLIAKLILASSRPDDLVFDPFAGSGTTLVAAKKLGRRFLGVEIESRYAAISVARLRKASLDSRIQGYEGGVFYDRNFRS